MNELPAVKKPPVFKRNLIAKVQFLTELCYCMNSADSIAQITEKVDDTIQQAKSLLAPTDGRLVIHDKRKMINETNSNSVQIKKFKPLKEEKRKHYYSGRFGKKAEIIKQFYKAKIYLKNLIENKGKKNTVEEKIAPIDLGSYCIVNSSDKEHGDNDSDTSISPLSKLQRHYTKILSSPTKWLDDKVIHKAQQFIKEKFSNIDSFQDPVLYDHFVPVNEKFVQVLNVNKNHWVCVAGEGNNEIHIHNSLLIKINNKSMHVIAKMLKCEDEVLANQFQNHTSSKEKQKQSNCGLLALALTFDLPTTLIQDDVKSDPKVFMAE